MSSDSSTQFALPWPPAKRPGSFPKYTLSAPSRGQPSTSEPIFLANGREIGSRKEGQRADFVIVVLPTKCRQGKMAVAPQSMKMCRKCKCQKCLESIAKTQRIRRFLTLNLARCTDLDIFFQKNNIIRKSRKCFLLSKKCGTMTKYCKKTY